VFCANVTKIRFLFISNIIYVLQTHNFDVRIFSITLCFLFLLDLLIRTGNSFLFVPSILQWLFRWIFNNSQGNQDLQFKAKNVFAS